MKVSIVTTAYNLPQATLKLFETVMLDSDKHDIDFYLFLHSRHQETVNMCESLASIYPSMYYDYGVNRGLSTSWNDGILEAYNNSADIVIVANDDILFTPGDIDKIAKKAAANLKNYMVSCAGYHDGYNGRWQPSHGYSCFAINPITIETICCFDENIFPIYMEDCDHHRRATLYGLVEENCRDTHVRHSGSSAINSDELLALQNLKTQKLSGEYYVRKWGGINEHEIYDTPFNNPDFTLRIGPEERHSPYGPGFDRDDKDMKLR